MSLFWGSFVSFEGFITVFTLRLHFDVFKASFGCLGALSGLHFWGSFRDYLGVHL